MSVPKEAWVRHRKQPQASLGVTQRGLPPSLGNHSPFLLPPKANHAVTRPLDTSVNVPASSKTSHTREEPVSELQRCHVPALISPREKTGWLFPSLTCSRFLLAQGRCVSIHLKSTHHWLSLCGSGTSLQNWSSQEHPEEFMPVCLFRRHFSAAALLLHLRAHQGLEIFFRKKLFLEKYCS